MQRQLAAMLTPSKTDRKPNAFDLIKTGLDISALFEARSDVVARHTRFSSRAPAATIAESVEGAAVAVGGRVERQDPGRCGAGWCEVGCLLLFHLQSRHSPILLSHAVADARAR